MSYDPTREVYAALDKTFVEQYRKQAGVALEVKQSQAALGGRARNVIDGSEKANVVPLALISDVEALQKRGLIAPDWQSARQTIGSPTRPPSCSSSGRATRREFTTGPIWSRMAWPW